MIFDQRDQTRCKAGLNRRYSRFELSSQPIDFFSRTTTGVRAAHSTSTSVRHWIHFFRVQVGAAAQ